MVAPTSLYRQTVETTHKSIVTLEGSFIPNGSGTPAASGIIGNWIDSVAHTSTGVWTVTIKEGFRGFQGITSKHLTLQFDTASPSLVQYGAIDLDAGTIVIRVYTESTGTLALADIAADPDNRIDILIHAKSSPIPDGSGIS